MEELKALGIDVPVKLQWVHGRITVVMSLDALEAELVRPGFNGSTVG